MKVAFHPAKIGDRGVYKMMYPHFYKNIQGWMNSGQRKLYEYQVKHATDNSHFVEIGAWKGKSTSYMAIEILHSNKNIKFDVIDTVIYIEGVSTSSRLQVPIKILRYSGT